MSWWLPACLFQLLSPPGCPLRCWLWGALCGLIVAKSPITARFGGDVTLGCLFPAQPGMDLQRLTLTWQKEQAVAEALVVHSYYYGRDQLTRQAEAYRNRTRLDPEGLARGNAALTLRGVCPQDEGVYRCHVTSELGQTSEHSELRMEAPYGEPHLTFDLSFRRGHALLTFSSGGGYPLASVEWRDGTGTNLTELSSTTESVDARGLYNLRSELAVPEGPIANLTVLLVTAGRETPVQLITLIEGPGLGGSWVPLLGLCLVLIIPAVMTSPTCLPQDVHTPPADKSWPPALPGQRPGQRKCCAGSQTVVLRAALRHPCVLSVNATSQPGTQRAQPPGESPGGRALGCESLLSHCSPAAPCYGPY